MIDKHAIRESLKRIRTKKMKAFRDSQEAVTAKIKLAEFLERQSSFNGIAISQYTYVGKNDTNDSYVFREFETGVFVFIDINN